jgi:hypothetical protein
MSPGAVLARKRSTAFQDHYIHLGTMLSCGERGRRLHGSDIRSAALRPSFNYTGPRTAALKILQEFNSVKLSASSPPKQRSLQLELQTKITTQVLTCNNKVSMQSFPVAHSRSRLHNVTPTAQSLPRGSVRVSLQHLQCMGSRSPQTD